MSERDRGVGRRWCHRWVRCYTRRLPAEVAARRHAEVESDLWEHEQEARAAGVSPRAVTVEILGRMLTGVPADLAWRRSVRRATPAPPRVRGAWLAAPHPRLETCFVVLVAVDVSIAIAMLPGVAIGQATGLADGMAFDVGMILWAAATFACAVALGLGLLWRGRRPLVALGLLTLGAAAPAVTWFWLPPAYLLTIATVVLAVVTTPRRSPKATVA
jgi:hypothetical protein